MPLESRYTLSEGLVAMRLVDGNSILFVVIHDFGLGVLQLIPILLDANVIKHGFSRVNLEIVEFIHLSRLKGIS